MEEYAPSCEKASIQTSQGLSLRPKIKVKLLYYSSIPGAEKAFSPSIKRTRLDLEMYETLNKYQFRNREEKNIIAQFLAEYTFLLPLLMEARARIKKTYGANSQIVLELEEDPEENFDELFIVIQTEKNQKEALALLNKLDNDWFLEVIPETKNLLNITVETRDEL